MHKEVTYKKVAQVIEAVRNCYDVTSSCKKFRLPRTYFYDIINEDPQLKEEYYAAQGNAQQILLNKLATSDKPSAQQWLLERVHWKTYGRHIDRKSPDDVSEKQRKTLFNSEIDVQVKIQLLVDLYLDAKISADTYDKILQALKCLEPDLARMHAQLEMMPALLDVPDNNRDKK